MSSKLYFSPDKTEFYRRKVTCRPYRTEKNKLATRCFIITDNMQRRTNRIEILLTDEELAALKAKAGPFGSLSCYIRSALKEFSDADAKARMEALEKMAAASRKFSADLAWAGGNLNQAMKRANELAVLGLLTVAYYKETVLPSINNTKTVLDKMIITQQDTLNKIIKECLRN